MIVRSGNASLAGIVCLTGVVCAAAELPALPHLSIDDFPREVRQQVQQAYDFASAHPNDAKAAGKLAMLFDLYHRPDDAVRCYERSQKLSPTSFEWFYYEGILRSRQKNYAQAVELFHHALRLGPTCLPARLKYAENLLGNGNLAESNTIYQAILKDHPQSAEAYYGLGRISSLRADIPAAIGFLRRAVELFPRYGAAHYALAQAYRKAGDRAAADVQLSLYEASQTLVPPIEDPLRDTMRSLDMAAAAHLEWGLELQQVGRLQDAITETERAAYLDPQLVPAQVNLIILYGQAGDFTKGEEHFRRAVALNPHQFADAYYNYGVLLMKNNRFTEAIQAMRRAIEIKPAYADAHNNLGYILERQRNLDEAAREYQRAIDAKPDFRQAHFNLGRILINRKEYEAAIAQLRQTLLPADETTPSYLYALGAAYGRAGNKEQALKYLAQAQVQARSYAQEQLLADIERDIRQLSSEPHP